MGRPEGQKELDGGEETPDDGEEKESEGVPEVEPEASCDVEMTFSR